MTDQFMLHMDWEFEFWRMEQACSGRTGGTLLFAAANRALTAPCFSPPMLLWTTTMAGYSCVVAANLMATLQASFARL
jgi:hypothetical protein